MQKQPSVEKRSNPISRNTPEKLRYFYHPVHIGSTSWVTDSARNGIQYCEYLPYKKLRFFSSLAFGKTNEFVLHSLPASVGEPFLEKRSTTWNSRYTFSGKERDGETGYSYFGARYYSSDYSIWLSVDPLSDKYLSMSPYMYCGGNPVRLVDVDGREIWIKDGNTKYQYKNGSLYDKNGIEVPPNENSYAAKVLNNLNKLANSKNKRILSHLSDLEKSKHIHTISCRAEFTINFATPTNKDDIKIPAKGSGSNIYYNPTITFDYPDGSDNYAPATLAHELLGHAWDYDQAKYTDERIENGLKLTEINAINIGNIILRENNKNPRSQYGVSQNDNVKWMTIPEEYLDKYFTP